LTCTADVLTLLADHGRQLHALLWRLTLRRDVAEDLMQELFLKLAQSDRLGRAKDPLAYALRTATNLAFDWRRAQRQLPPTEVLFGEPTADDRSPLSRLVRREEVERVLDTIGQLPKPGCDIIVLRYLEQYEYDAIARQFGKTPHQVRALCYKAVRRLRSLLEQTSSACDESEGS